MKDERFIVTYRIEADTYEDAKSIAWAVQVEQTIEFPYEFVTDPYIKETVTGRLESLEPIEQGSAYANVGIMPNAVIDVSRYYVARIFVSCRYYSFRSDTIFECCLWKLVLTTSHLGGRCRIMSKLFMMCLTDLSLVCKVFVN